MKHVFDALHLHSLHSKTASIEDVRERKVALHHNFVSSMLRFSRDRTVILTVANHAERFS